MPKSTEELNYDFSYNALLCRMLIPNLTRNEDRAKASRWINKLVTCNRSIDEMKLRNDFTYFLVINVQNGELQAPFNEFPTPTPLLGMANLLPSGGVTAAREGGKEGARRPLLYEQSPDGGAFLAAQPIPKCGAFCYLAVVSKSKSD